MLAGLAVAGCGGDEQQARRDLVALGQSIQIGDTAESTLDKCQAAQAATALRCLTKESGILSVATRRRFDASNWRLHVGFRDGKVTVIRFETDDNMQTPPGAPSARGAVR